MRPWSPNSPAAGATPATGAWPAPDEPQRPSRTSRARPVPRGPIAGTSGSSRSSRPRPATRPSRPGPAGRPRTAATRFHPEETTVPDHDTLYRLPGPDPVPAALLALADHAEELTSLAGRLDDTGTRLLALEQYLDGEPDNTAYSPVPAPRWWMLATAERAAPLDRLAAWVD